MKTLTYVLIGAGQRGRRYTENAYRYQDCELVAVAEPNDYLREVWTQKYNVPKSMCFRSYEEVFALGRIADFAVICTQDKLHFAPAMKAIELGYNILLEKPVAPTPEECMAVCEAAEKKGVHVMVCHVLRYTPFARKVKDILDSGRLGRIMSVVHVEGVGNTHYATSFVRGHWHNSAESSDMLLAKSCHDIDLLQWLLGSRCVKVQSFGELSYFTAANCPKGAPERCMDGCPAADSCPYDATKIYRDFPESDGGWWKRYIGPRADLSTDEINDILRNTDYGRCVFRCNNDVVDHQTVNLQYKNGETVVFTMAAFNKGGRRIHIMGTKGELISTDFDTIELNIFCDDAPGRIGQMRTEHIRTSDEVIDQSIFGGHGGGDVGIIEDLWKLFGDGEATKSVSDIRTSVLNHMTVFAAEQSRKNGGVLVDVGEYVRQFAKV